MDASRRVDRIRTDREEGKLWHYYFTTYAWWIAIVSAILHITTHSPRTPSVVTDAAFSIAFGVAVVGTLISSNWGKKIYKIWGFHNLLTHILPFVVILATVLKYPTPPAAIWKTIVLACLPPLMYDFACGDRSEMLYQTFSPNTKKVFMVPILASVIICGVFVRSFIDQRSGFPWTPTDLALRRATNHPPDFPPNFLY